MTDFPIITSYYTLGTPYEHEVQNLLSSCERYDLEYTIEGIASFGSWELNCAYKPFFLLKKLNELGQPLLWVDADGMFVQKPSWIDAFESDIATRINQELSSDHPSSVISSTIYLSPTPQTIQVLKTWAAECYRTLLDPDRTLEFWDQIALRDALLESEAVIKPLPLSYAKIFDHPVDNILVESPVIEHYQASRRFKTLI